MQPYMSPQPCLPVFQSKSHVAALGAIQFAISERKLMLLLGEPGSGKTTLLLTYSGDLSKSHYILCSPNMGIKDLLKTIAYELNLQIRGNAYEMQRQVTNELRVHPNHCFMLDECEYLNRNNISKLEVLRQIWDETGVPFIFCGTYKLEDELKGSSKKNTNHSQIYRRLYKATLGIMNQQEVYDYLDLLEKEYAVRFLPDARSDLYAQCRDRENGGMGNFIALIELAFTVARPEWKAISMQLNHIRSVSHKISDTSPCDPESAPCDFNEYTESESKGADLRDIFEPIDVSSLKIASISRDIIRSASKYKVTR